MALKHGYLSIRGFTALVGIGSFFSFVIYTQPQVTTSTTLLLPSWGRIDVKKHLLGFLGVLLVNYLMILA
jgi:hypothetical protein